MDRLIDWVLRRRKVVIVLALVLCAVSLYTMRFVTVSYDMASYLPASAPSTIAMKMVDEGMPNLQLYIPDISVQEALEAKKQLKAMPNIQSVLWLDDSVDLRATPIEALPEKQISPYYAEGGALFQVTVDTTNTAPAYESIMARFPDAKVKGEAAFQALVQTVSMGEIASIMYYVLPLVLLILLVSTRHWLEPVLFLIAIGIAILINEGSNIILGKISFVTQACSAVLQLAVSIDYAVFLLHRFSEYREQGMEPFEAMKLAMKTSASAIAASAMTTVFGFLALLAMRFGLGKDMGLVLAKGVMLSYLSVIIVLPAVAMSLNGLMQKTAHRVLMPSFRRTGRFIVRVGGPIAILAALMLVPAFLAQHNNRFMYGSSGNHGPGSPAVVQAAEIERVFGRSQPMLLMVPEGEMAKTAQLSKEIKALPYVRDVISYPETVGLQIPPEVLPAEQLRMLRDKGYDRIIFYADLPPESEASFAAVEELRGLARAAYGDSYHLVGESVVNYDLMHTITGDNLPVLLLGMLAIGLTILVTFGNVSIPLILLLIIEGAIWFNMAQPYVMGDKLNYIGYQIVSSVQLGATVDYGILLSQRYLEARRSMRPREAAGWALSKSMGSILPPMLILVIAGYALKIVVSSNAIVSQMGEILGRGAAISGLMVMLVLPKVLAWCDGLIQKTYLKKQQEAFFK